MLILVFNWFTLGAKNCNQIRLKVFLKTNDWGCVFYSMVIYCFHLVQTFKITLSIYLNNCLSLAKNRCAHVGVELSHITHYRMKNGSHAKIPGPVDG